VCISQHTASHHRNLEAQLPLCSDAVKSLQHPVATARIQLPLLYGLLPLSGNLLLTQPLAHLGCVCTERKAQRICTTLLNAIREVRLLTGLQSKEP
jgi:hypothetical protein